MIAESVERGNGIRPVCCADQNLEIVLWDHLPTPFVYEIRGQTDGEMGFDRLAQGDCRLRRRIPTGIAACDGVSGQRIRGKRCGVAIINEDRRIGGGRGGIGGR